MPSVTYLCTYVRLTRDALRAAYVTPSSSTSLVHGSSGPVPLQLPIYRSQHPPPPDPAPVTGLLASQQPASNLSAPVYGGVPMHVAYKRPAMLSSEYGQVPGRRALLEPLKIDTDLKKVVSRYCCYRFVCVSFVIIVYVY